jgi:hypothetical protein
MKTPLKLSSLVVVAAVTALVHPEAARSQDALLTSAISVESKEVSGMKSEGTATLLSFAGTAIPMTLGMVLANAGEGGAGSGLGLALFSYGMYLGPATGYWYAGASGAAWKGVGLRVGISVVTVAVTAALCSGGGCEMFGDDSAMAAVGIVGLAALGATAYSLIRDIAGVDGEVRNHNAEVAARQEPSRLTIAPLISPADGGTVGVLGQIRM